MIMLSGERWGREGNNANEGFKRRRGREKGERESKWSVRVWKRCTRLPSNTFQGEVEQNY